MQKEEDLFMMYLLGGVFGVFQNKRDFDNFKMIANMRDCIEFRNWLNSGCSFLIKESTIDNACENFKIFFEQYIDSLQGPTEQKELWKLQCKQNLMQSKQQLKIVHRDKIIKL
ncbi:MAG: hypothetical protein IJV31_07235 [Clostridia bacterium]|nr:hypothetical protein [Bacteroidales bacterium]MBQ9658542.1 hypothetical protein [Clostridia bacterium]